MPQRRLSDLVYRQLMRDAHSRAAAGPGHAGRFSPSGPARLDLELGPVAVTPCLFVSWPADGMPRNIAGLASPSESPSR